MSRWQRILKHPLSLPLAFVVCTSYFTYMHDYTNPPQLFWDENYHIASAQKYLNNVYFMEPHPPLGKLLIAAGEALLSPQQNGNSDQFVTTDYGKNIPSGFSFAGYRLFPTLLGWLTAPLLFGIFYLLLRQPLIALLLSNLYIFDNALIVHSRSAMLESTLLFFSVAAIFCFLLLREYKDNKRLFGIFSLLFGMCFAAVVTTKANGLIIVLLIPALLWLLWDKKRAAVFLGLQTLGFLVVYIGVWQTHFALGDRVMPELPDNGYYQASEEYKDILAFGSNGSLFNFPVMLRDSLAFLPHYARGVPRLDMCKDGENGSYFMFWPIGAKTISYRWETPDSVVYRYLYLVANPVIWLFGLLGVLLSTALLTVSNLLPVKQKLQRPREMMIFLGLYVSYMIAIGQLDRVMYLYHYFFPLVMSFILFGLAVGEIRQLGKWQVNDQLRTVGLTVCSLLMIASFHFYRPLSYNEPISDEAFKRRAIIPLWDLKCVNCQRDNPLIERSC